MKKVALTFLTIVRLLYFLGNFWGLFFLEEGGGRIFFRMKLWILGLCVYAAGTYTFFFLRISLEFSFLLYLMKVKKAAPSAACNDVEMYCEACMKKIWLGSSLGSFDVYLYQLSTKGLGPRYKEIQICGLRC